MLGFLDALRHDVRYALRQVARSPGFAIVAIASLAIGIGANVTIFSAANAFLNRPVSASHPEELIRIYRGEHSPLPRDWFQVLSEHSRTLSAIVAEDPLAVGVDRDGTGQRIMASVVSENFFTALGVGPAAGSVFSGTPGEPVGSVVVLSHAFWTSRLAGDPTIVGRTLRINDLPFLVVGVAREGFRSSQFGWGPELYLPVSELPHLRGVPPERAGISSMYITARLAPGQSPEQALAEVRALAPTFPRADSLIARPGAFTVERAQGITAEVRGPATIASTFLMVVVGLVLLIACANLGNLLLARGMARRREIAIRTALGVSRARLVRQLLTESTVIALLGGAGGLALATWVTGLLPSLIPAGAPVSLDLSPDRTVLFFAIALALGTGLLFGLAPALQASKADVHSMLRASGAGGGRRSRLRSAFLGGQVALAMVLLIASALFLRGLAAARSLDPGFSSEGVLNVGMDLSLRTYDAARGGVYYMQVMEHVRALPDVAEASLIATPPLTGSNSGTSVLPASAGVTDREASRGTTFTSVADGYFELARIPLIAGRPITSEDRAGLPPVAVVNESFARMMWADELAVGKQFRVFGEEPLITVVGVTRDTKYKSLNDSREPFMYLPIAQSFSNTAVVQARLRADSPAARTALREAVQGVDPGLPLDAVQSMDEAMGISLLPARVGAVLLGAFGALALLLATIGVYGVTAYVVGLRTAEIGIRTALGAPAAGVLRLLMSETLRIVLIGVGVGLAGGAGIGALVSSQLYGVGAFDPLAFAGASGLLIVVALVGTWMPARRALRADPLIALRAE